MNKFEVLETIGEGTYGVVVKAKNKDTNELVAIKKFKDSAKSFIKRELKMLNSLKSCEFIVTLKEAYKRKEKIYFVFEYVERNLLQLLQEFPSGLNQSTCKNLLFQLCKAVEKCHSLDIIHRDIKPENLLVDQNHRLKLCDFGFARKTFIDENEGNYTEYVATRWYRSPELLLQCPYGKPADIWAIGCIACELSNGRPLFPGKSDLDQLHLIQSVLGGFPDYQLETLRKNRKFSNLKILKYERVTSLDRKYFNIMGIKLLDFTKKALKLNPDERLCIKDCIEHCAFQYQLKAFTNKSNHQNAASRSRDSKLLSRHASLTAGQNSEPKVSKYANQSVILTQETYDNVNLPTEEDNDKVHFSRNLNESKPQRLENRLKSIIFPMQNNNSNTNNSNTIKYEDSGYFAESKPIEKNIKSMTNGKARKEQLNVRRLSNIEASYASFSEIDNVEAANDRSKKQTTSSLLASILNTNHLKPQVETKLEQPMNTEKLLKQRSLKRSKSTLESGKVDYQNKFSNYGIRNSTLTPSNEFSEKFNNQNNDLDNSIEHSQYDNDSKPSKKMINSVYNNPNTLLMEIIDLKRKTPEVPQRKNQIIYQRQPFTYRSIKSQLTNNSNSSIESIGNHNTTSSSKNMMGDEIFYKPFRATSLKKSNSIAYHDFRERNYF